MTTSLFAHQAPDTLEPADRWQRQAECAATDETGAPVYDPELWFPIGEGPVAQQQAADAKAVCYQCPVVNACLRSALEDHEDVGVWGGLDETERRRLHGRRARTPAAPRKPRNLPDVLAAHSNPVPGGHTEWTGSTPTIINRVSYTPAQLAWHVAHGAAPTGQVTTECGHQGCITAAHLLDAAGRAEQHGSVAAYKAHLRRGEEPCEECKAGRAARDRARRTKTADGCGTTKAYYQHLMAGEPVDEACQAASDAYEQQLTPAPEPAACGTRGGYQKHRRNDETACAPCRQANADADRRLRNTGTTKPLTERSAA
ncbi:WhiB family transcriptional regulator [[Kitasatospora] papulosa]|uniref:WhiB family transcriptional regulator n=1 Tax=[Kitasatospora] papulosa TaxID=1464011 RepID=UPI0037D55331